MPDAVERMATDVFASIRGLVSRSVAALKAEVDSLAGVVRELQQRPPPKDGSPGKDAEVDYAKLAAMVSATVGEAIKSFPAPKDGAPGKDAEPVDLAKLASDAAALIPSPKDGTDPDYERIGEIVRGMVTEQVAAIPMPRDGKPGKSVALDDVRPLIERGLADIAAGLRVPADGKSVTVEDVRPLFEAAFSAWALDFERRAQDLFAKAIEKMPRAKDGADGIGFDHLSAEYDGRRRFVLRFTQGERVVEFPIVMPIVIDAGVYREGESYEKGDGVTWGGNYWIAQEDTDTKPEAGNKAWRLAVRKGRDAK